MSGGRLESKQAAEICADLLRLAGYEVHSVARDWSIYGHTSWSIRYGDGQRVYRTDQVLAALRNEPFDFVP